MTLDKPMARASAAPVLINLLLFKLSWVLLVVWQDQGLLPALLLQGLSLYLHPARQTAWQPLLQVAATGVCLDQLLSVSGVFIFPTFWLPLWLLLLWLAFGNVLTLGLRVLQHLHPGLQALIGAACGAGSYFAGHWFSAVEFGLPTTATLLLLGAVWAPLLPLLLHLARPRMAVRRQTVLGLPLVGSVLLCFGLAGNPAEAGQQSYLIGSGTFRYLIWPVYDASLHAAEPGFSFPDTVPFTLTLEYRRAFTGQQIVNETLKQWRLQGLEFAPAWEEWLRSLVPDVVPGDRLALALDAGFRATLIHNDAVLGHSDDPDLSLAFAGIWLAENTTHPNFRAQLLGVAQ